MLRHTVVKYENNVILHRLSIFRTSFIQEFTSRGYPTKCNHVSLPVYAITKTLHVNSFVPHEYSPYIQNDSNEGHCIACFLGGIMSYLYCMCWFACVQCVEHELIIWFAWRVSYKRKELLTLRDHLSWLPILWCGLGCSSFTFVLFHYMSLLF